MQRLRAEVGYTPGSLAVNGVFECYSLEDELRHGVKIPGQTCIAAGRYPVMMTMSVRFERITPELQGVPNFVGVRIHGGRTAADTKGCVLVGDKSGPGELYFSTQARKRLDETILAAREAGEDVWIDIVNPEGWE